MDCSLSQCRSATFVQSGNVLELCAGPRYWSQNSRIFSDKYVCASRAVWNFHQSRASRLWKCCTSTVSSSIPALSDKAEIVTTSVTCPPADANVASVPSRDSAVRVVPVLEAFSSPSFRDAVEGEWFGYEVAFGVRDGAPVPIEERYVPDEFRAWGVEVKGFEVVSSSRVVDDKLVVKRTRALPSVGCEADAVATEIRVDQWAAVDEQQSNARQYARLGIGFENGGYLVGPALLSEDVHEPWHMCLADPRPEMRGKKRARFTFGKVDEPRGAIISIVETWDGKFCDGALLPGCGGKNASFADEAPIVPMDVLAAHWAVDSCVYEYSQTSNAWIQSNASSTLTRTADDAAKEANVALPLGITVGISSSPSGGKRLVAGWLTDPNRRATVLVDFDVDGNLICVNSSTELRINRMAASGDVDSEGES